MKIEVGDKVLIEGEVVMIDSTEPKYRVDVGGRVWCSKKDIKEVIKPAFNWDDVKAGQEYIVRGSYADYVGYCKETDEHTFYLKGCCAYSHVKTDEKVEHTNR